MIRKYFCGGSILPLLLIILAPAASVQPQNFTGGYNFNMPYNDSASRKFLPSFPIKSIGQDDFVKINTAGHFAVNGSRVRFWGTNLVADGAFPDKAKAATIAGRLRKMGFNLIRFHHLDNPWSQYSLFVQGQTTRQLNAAMLDRMEYIIGELKKNGIYINMNLNVGRTFNRYDGVADADSLTDFGKAVTIFDPQLIALQKEYAGQLLTHTNPYTGLQLRNDPVMAMMEIINENSLYRWWHDGRLTPFALGGSLTIRHTRMLDSMWNRYLLNRYQGTAALAAEWNRGAVTGGIANQVLSPGFEESNFTSNWIFEQHNGAAAGAIRDDVNPYQGTYSCKISVTAATGTAWHLQFKQPSLTAKKDSLYTVSFAARSDSSRVISVAVMRDNSPYTWYTGADYQLSAGWRVYTFSFKAPETNSGQVRLTFQLASKGIYWLDEVKFSRAAVNGLLTGEQLENNSVKRIAFNECPVFTDTRVRDMSDFYISLQDTFLTVMKNYLKVNLGVKVPLTGTNWNIGPGDLITQASMDYIDNHAYWDHPQFPGVPWSTSDWFINNTPMVQSGSGGTIPGLFSGVPSAGKPLTVSEYNHAFPNRYQCEMPLFASAYLSFNDADAVMLFDYNGSTDWESDKINGYFDIHRNPVYMAQMPSAAAAFRDFMIDESRSPIQLQYSRADVLLMPKYNTGDWSGPVLYDKKIALQHAVKNSSFNAGVSTDFNTVPVPGQSPYKTDTDEITYNTGGLLSVNTARFTALTGLLGSFSGLENGPVKLSYASNLGMISWICLNGDSLKTAPLSLLTVTSAAQNTAMIWNGTTTVNNNWGTPPVMLLPLKVILKLNIYADSIIVTPMDSTGAPRIGAGIVYYPAEPNFFEITIDQNTSRSPWYAVEKFGSGSMAGISNSGAVLPDEFLLEQNYPNPFNSSTTVRFYNPEYSRVTVKITDLLGREIRALYDGAAPRGYTTLSWDGRGGNGSPVSAGVYCLSARSGNKTKIIKLLLLK